MEYEIEAKDVVEQVTSSHREQRLVRLLQCGRRSCGYVLAEDEREWLQDPEWSARKTAHCPKCGEDGFYTLNEKGQQITTRDREKYRDGLDPTLIDPSPRMGPKNRQMILAAKQRILEANASGHSPREIKP